MKIFKPWQVSLITVFLLSFIFCFSDFSSSTAFSLKNPFEISERTQSLPALKKGMYVIVGSFQIPENALKYARSITIRGENPNVGRNNENGLYYVYAYSTFDDLESARAKRAELRATNQFYDAWILYVGITLDELLMEETPDQLVMEQPKEIDAGELNIEETKEEDFVPPPPVEEDQNLYNYRFSVINATTLKEVPGYVTIIDAARNKAMKSVSTNQIHQLEAPTTQTKEIIALCDIFGFVKEQVKFKIDDPMSSPDSELMEQSGGITTVKFELARHKVGDILTMYHVYFYNNSAIMKPESKFELNSLLSMLKENEKLEIKIHGHTNGNAAGKIISLRDEDKNYFEVTPNNVEAFGSAKKLSKARADIIARWLIDNGISKKRMDIKGWGGKKMIYKKNDTMASRNVRVEIEIVKG
jgi:outer membrane protein OmpA-like peptidoglycan-associated protein